MTAAGAMWHLVGFFAVPLLFGLCAAALVCLVWRRSLSGRSFWRLALTACSVSVLAALVGLVATGRDGGMLTYAGMVLACAAVLWWPLRVKR